VWATLPAPPLQRLHVRCCPHQSVGLAKLCPSGCCGCQLHLLEASVRPSGTGQTGIYLQDAAGLARLQDQSAALAVLGAAAAQQPHLRKALLQRWRVLCMCPALLLVRAPPQTASCHQVGGQCPPTLGAPCTAQQTLKVTSTALARRACHARPRRPRDAQARCHHRSMTRTSDCRLSM
jgi:hypothetical protein